jgi:hypothetical protein
MEAFMMMGGELEQIWGEIGSREWLRKGSSGKSKVEQGKKMQDGNG